MACPEDYSPKTAPAQNKTNQEVSRTDSGPESIIVENESTQRQTETSELVEMETPVQQEPVDNNSGALGEILANLDSEDIPTFDEALEMEVVAVDSPQNDVRRRVSSRLSLKSEELPDYENYESHPVISGIEKL